MSDDPTTAEVARFMRYLANQRWSKATAADKSAQAKKMVAGRRKAARKRARGAK